MARVLYTAVALMPVMAASCSAPSVDPTTVAKGQGTAESAAATAQEFLENRLALDCGIEFELPVRAFDQDTGEIHQWKILQDFNVTSDATPKCAELYPDCLHAGVDYQVVGDHTGKLTEGSPVFPIAPGSIIAIHSRPGDGYPGQAVLVLHDTDRGPIYSMYGHITVNPALSEATPHNIVDRDTELGRIMLWPDHISPGAPNTHLHFEIRTFGSFPEHLATQDVANRTAFACNQCAVGPGYWLNSEGGPVRMGWLDPVEMIEDSQS